jgi:hypothetical protein
MKAQDKTKIPDIKMQLQSRFGAAQASENFGELPGVLSEGVQSVISVSWIGGGHLQDSESLYRALDQGRLKRNFLQMLLPGESIAYFASRHAFLNYAFSILNDFQPSSRNMTPLHLFTIRRLGSSPSRRMNMRDFTLPISLTTT